jgi:hypothetical protein
MGRASERGETIAVADGQSSTALSARRIFERGGLAALADTTPKTDTRLSLNPLGTLPRLNSRKSGGRASQSPHSVRVLRREIERNLPSRSRDGPFAAPSPDEAAHRASSIMVLSIFDGCHP